jgi:hypothetical protein
VTRWRAGAVLGGALLLASCSSSPVLLDGADFDGVESTTQDDGGALAPGWTWCDDLRPGLYTGASVTSTFLTFDDEARAGATIIDLSEDARSSDYVLEQYAAAAEGCAESDAASRGYTIDRITGLGDGETGWTTRRSDGEWGQYVLVRLDDVRVLAVGFSTTEDEAPVDLDDLVERATVGAEQFPASEG